MGDRLLSLSLSLSRVAPVQQTPKGTGTSRMLGTGEQQGEGVVDVWCGCWRASNGRGGECLSYNKTPSTHPFSCVGEHANGLS